MTKTRTTTTVADPHNPDWHAQLGAAVRTRAALECALHLTDGERQGLLWARQAGMPVLVTPYYLSLASAEDPNCPIRRQCVPTIAESRCVDGDLSDPLAEEEHEVAPHLVRRYQDRALLLVTTTCAVHCRFCTRSRLVAKREGYVSLSKLEPAFRWLEANPEVQELLISGGDPLVASTERLEALLGRIRRIPTIGVVRIGTRVPIVLPMRIDNALVRMLRSFQPLWIMTHFNHPLELTDSSREAVEKFIDAGIPLMNQTVLLRGINDDEETLAKLFRELVHERVRPYYLLHADAVRGTGHLRTSLARSIELYSRLQGRLSGLAVPRLMVDTPGGRGKVPVGQATVVSMSERRTVLRTYRGENVTVIDPEDSETNP